MYQILRNINCKYCEIEYLMKILMKTNHLNLTLFK